MEGKNLRLVTKETGKTRSEGYLVSKTYTDLEEMEGPIKGCLRSLDQCRKPPTWAAFNRILSSNHPLVHRQLSSYDENSFQVVGNPFDRWVKGIAPADNIPTDGAMQCILTMANRDINSLSGTDRAQFLRQLIHELRDEVADDLFEAVRKTETLRQELTNVHDEVDRRVLASAEVIGVTTTGLAKRINALQHVNAKVIICEEAGEICEPHMLSALLPTIEHVISIGDHEQLRPQINNYNLSMESQRGLSYQLDRSQFERLSIGESGRPPFPVAQLNVQRRMRPEISRLIRPIYPRLTDHEVTKNLP